MTREPFDHSTPHRVSNVATWLKAWLGQRGCITREVAQTVQGIFGVGTVLAHDGRAVELRKLGVQD